MKHKDLIEVLANNRHVQLPRAIDWESVRNEALILRMENDKMSNWMSDLRTNKQWDCVFTILKIGKTWIRSKQCYFSKRLEGCYELPFYSQAAPMSERLYRYDVPLGYWRPFSNEVFLTEIKYEVTIEHTRHADGDIQLKAYREAYLGDDLVSGERLESLFISPFSCDRMFRRVDWPAVSLLFNELKAKRQVSVKMPPAHLWASWLAGQYVDDLSDDLNSEPTEKVDKALRMADWAERLHQKHRLDSAEGKEDKPAPTFFKMHGALERIRETAAA